MRPASKCWMGLAAGVIAADWWLIRNGHETLSTVFGQNLAQPTRRLLVASAWGILTAHLFSELMPIPDKWSRYDPIGWAVKQVPRKVMDEAISAVEAINPFESQDAS